MKNDSDVLFLTKYQNWTARGKQVYGCRGIGPKYNKFWEEMQTVKFDWEHDDFPWSYFTFNEEDEKVFLEKYSSEIYLVEDDEPYDSVYDKPPDTRTAEEIKNEKLLAEILNTEIQKEINKAVIDTICRNSK